MVDNVIPFIKGEEEKSEQEPLKIWGTIERRPDRRRATSPAITAQCIRVPVSDGHMAAVFVAFEQEAVARADPVRVERVRRQAAAAEAAERADAVPPRTSKTTRVRRRSSIAMPATARRSRSAACARRRDVRLALRRAVAQHGARRRGRRGADRRAAQADGYLAAKYEAAARSVALIAAGEFSQRIHVGCYVWRRNAYAISQCRVSRRAYRTRCHTSALPAPRKSSLSLAPTEADARP